MKNSSYGMIGGISLSDKKELDEYFNYMIDEHKKANPDIQILEKYVRIKNEIISVWENRNYIFHINQERDKQNIWSVIPGKFTLAFSIAPEFYRLIYKKNPKKFFNVKNDNNNSDDMVHDTVWGEIQKKDN